MFHDATLRTTGTRFCLTFHYLHYIILLYATIHLPALTHKLRSAFLDLINSPHVISSAAFSIAICITPLGLIPLISQFTTIVHVHHEPISYEFSARDQFPRYR